MDFSSVSSDFSQFEAFLAQHDVHYCDLDSEERKKWIVWYCANHRGEANHTHQITDRGNEFDEDGNQLERSAINISSNYSCHKGEFLITLPLSPTGLEEDDRKVETLTSLEDSLEEMTRPVTGVENGQLCSGFAGTIGSSNVHHRSLKT
jgi:hypothetical protein